MTPHLGDYYAKGIKEAGKPNTIPADWHSPTPIPLLAVESISLLFCIAPRLGKIDAQELAHLSIALQNALANMGAGAKTQTGFGRLIVDEAQRKKLEDKLEEQQKQQAKANASVEQQLILEANDIIHASPAAMLMAGQTNAVKVDALLKKTEGWSEADCASIWNNVVMVWIEKAYSDKAKRKEQYKKVTAKYAWLKAPQS
jgi:hypothetical protein